MFALFLEEMKFTKKNDRVTDMRRRAAELETDPELLGSVSDAAYRITKSVEML